MKKIILLILLLISTKVISQDFPDNPTQIQEIPPSPTMWEFEKYGNYPVSMHTGVPNISIPLGAAQSGELQVPISLNYHASGIKVDQKATWVGLGWNLSAGGAITRTIRGSNDEQMNGYINHHYSDENTIDPQYDYADIEAMIIGSIDTEPDIFNYSFLGYSGKFIFNHATSRDSATIALIPHNDLTVVPTFTGATITAFTIVTPEGITAEFAYPESSYEYRGSNLVGDYTVNAYSTWHLKKITTSNEIDEITFEYKTITSVTDERISERESINYPDPCNMFNNQVTSSSRTNVTTYSNVKKLEKISFSNGYINFNSSLNNRIDDPNNGELRLDEIEIYSSINSIDKLIKSFEMEYDYFGYVWPSGDTPEYDVRLKLEKVYEKDADGSRSNPHEFSYNESSPYHDLPPRFSYKQDYWGYFNNNSNPSLVPAVQYLKRDGVNTITLGDADRNVDSQYVQAGLLNKIIYPTSGYTEFEFESNTATIMEGTNPVQYVTGGVRIKTISNFEEDESIQWQKSYEYKQKNNSSLSSGVYNATNYITPEDFLSGRAYYYNADLPGCLPGTYKTHTTYTDGVASSPAMANNFATVFYSEVKEYNGSPTTYAGYKWYYYDIIKDNLIQGLGPVSFYIDRSWDRGQLLLKETYEYGNNNPIATVTNIYEEIEAQLPISAYKAGSRFDVESLGFLPVQLVDQINFRDNQYFLTYYEEPIIWKRLVSTVTVYDGITTQKDFFYENPDHTQLTKTESNDSEGNFFISKIRYPDDFINSTTLYDNTLIKGGGINTYTAIDRLKSNDLHQNAKPIQVETYKKVGTTESLLSLQRTNFVDHGSDLVLPSIVQTLKGEYDSSTNPLQDRVNYSEYDDFGNPQEISKEGGSPTVYLWSYNNTLPVAKIDNATLSEVESVMNSFKSGFVTSLGTETDKEIIAGNLVQLRNDLAIGILSDALVNTYVYDPLIGTVMATAPNGLNSHYQYDPSNRLKAILNNDEDVVQYINYNYKSDPEIVLSNTTHTFSSSAESKSISVTSNRNWTVTEPVSWLSLSTSSGSNDGSFIIYCTANTGAERSATVTVTAEGVTQSILVTQEAPALDFTLTQIGTSYQTSSFSNSTINSSEQPNVIYYYLIDTYSNYGNIVLEGSDTFTFNIEYDYHASGWINATYNAANKTIGLTFEDPLNNFTNYASVNITSNGITKILSIKFVSFDPY